MLPPPDRATASRIESALRALHDPAAPPDAARAADAFLRAVRDGPPDAALPVCAALLLLFPASRDARRPCGGGGGGGGGALSPLSASPPLDGVATDNGLAGVGTHTLAALSAPNGGTARPVAGASNPNHIIATNIIAENADLHVHSSAGAEAAADANADPDPGAGAGSDPGHVSPAARHFAASTLAAHARAAPRVAAALARRALLLPREQQPGGRPATQAQPAERATVAALCTAAAVGTVAAASATATTTTTTTTGTATATTSRTTPATAAATAASASAMAMAMAMAMAPAVTGASQASIPAHCVNGSATAGRDASNVRLEPEFDYPFSHQQQSDSECLIRRHHNHQHHPSPAAAAFAAELAELRAAASFRDAECIACEAVAREASVCTTRDPRLHAVLTAVCVAEADAILRHAARVIVSVDNGRTLSIPSMRSDAVACIRAWIPYTQDIVGLVLDPLLHALTDSSTAGDAGLALSDAIEVMAARSKTPFNPQTVHKIVAALHLVFQRASASTGSADLGTSGSEQICHAIAELCVSIADCVADMLLDGGEACEEASHCRPAALELNCLMLACLRSSSHRTFEAALSAWDSWIASANMVQTPVDEGTLATLPDVIRTILNHLQAIQSAMLSDDMSLQFDDDDQIPARLRNAATDTLHQAAQLMSIAEYIQVLRDALPDETTLFALSAAGDVAYTERDVEALLSLLPRVVSLTHSHGTCHSPAVRRAALRVLAAFAHILVSPGIDDQYLCVALTSACRSLAELGSEPALLLQEASDVQPRRLLPFLHVLIDESQVAFGGLSMLALRLPQEDARSNQQMTVSDIVARALARVSAELPSQDARRDALNRIIRQPIDHLTMDRHGPCRGPCISRDLRLVAMAVRGINDSGIALSFLESFAPILATLAQNWASDGSVAPSICYLLEVSVAPTLVDPGDEKLRETLSNDGRNGHISFCIRLVSESFVRSGPRGEACWIMTLAKLAERALAGFMHDVDSTLPGAVHLAVQGLHQFVREDGSYARPDMWYGFLRLMVTLVEYENEHGAAAMRSAAEPCGQVAFVALTVDDACVLYEALSWWRLVLTLESLRDVAGRAVQHIGGSQSLCEALVLTAFYGSATRKCTQLAADIILLLQNGAELRPTFAAAPISDTDKVLVRRALTSAASSGVPNSLRKVISDIRRFGKGEIGAYDVFGASLISN